MVDSPVVWVSTREVATRVAPLLTRHVDEQTRLLAAALVLDCLASSGVLAMTPAQPPLGLNLKDSPLARRYASDSPQECYSWHYDSRAALWLLEYAAHCPDVVAAVDARLYLDGGIRASPVRGGPLAFRRRRCRRVAGTQPAACPACPRRACSAWRQRSPARGRASAAVTCAAAAAGAAAHGSGCHGAGPVAPGAVGVHVGGPAHPDAVHFARGGASGEVPGGGAAACPGCCCRARAAETARAAQACAWGCAQPSTGAVDCNSGGARGARVAAVGAADVVGPNGGCPASCSIAEPAGARRWCW